MAKKKQLRVPPTRPELGDIWEREDGTKFIWDHEWKKIVIETTKD